MKYIYEQHGQFNVVLPDIKKSPATCHFKLNNHNPTTFNHNTKLYKLYVHQQKDMLLL